MKLFGNRFNEVVRFNEDKFFCIGEYSEHGEPKTTMDITHNVYTGRHDQDLSTLYFFNVKKNSLSHGFFPYYPSKDLDFIMPVKDIDYIDFEYKPNIYVIHTEADSNSEYAMRIPADEMEGIKSIMESLLKIAKDYY